MMLARGRRYKVVKQIPPAVVSLDPTKSLILHGEPPMVGDIVILVDIHRRFSSNAYYFISETGKEFWIEAVTDSALFEYLKEL